ncbi:hypothetical protein [Virgisporangium aliadipatigenens]|uniref:hypothetical protein n=1 Tax=Virgisporangium aliadipatigenens TaxID=741659 RepID=UPI001EF291FC
MSANPRDRAARAFDMLYEKVVARLTSVARDRRCERAHVWRWAGDGGFLAVHDADESIALDVTLSFALKLLEMDLRHLRDEFEDLGIGGELHLRLAVHRGTINYRGVGFEGRMYSPDINFVAHLEKVAPIDTVTVSEDVYQVAGDFAKRFERAGSFEGRDVYVAATGPGPRRPGDADRAWLATHGLAGAVPIFGHHERPSQVEKARLVRAAVHEIVDIGSAIRTGARYLVTTERPAYFRDAVLDFLDRGGRYRCVLMDPDSESTRNLSLQRGEDFQAKIKDAMVSFQRFKERYGSRADGLEVYQTGACPTMGCVAVDLGQPHSVVLLSPYMTVPGTFGALAELAELPHYVIGVRAGTLYENVRRMVRAFQEEDVTRVM